MFDKNNDDIDRMLEEQARYLIDEPPSSWLDEDQEESSLSD